MSAHVMNLSLKRVKYISSAVKPPPLGKITWLPSSSFFQRSIMMKSFCSEEPGNDIYLVKDETGVFYPDRFKVDWCLDDNYETEYFTTFLDMYHYLKEYFPKAAFCYHDSIEDIKAAIDQMYGDTDDEYFVNINVFRDYYNDEAEYIVSREAA